MSEAIPVSGPMPEVRFPARIEAAMTAAARQGVDLPPNVAVRVADAVLECADDEYRVRMQVAREMWPQARDVAVERLGVQMARDLVARKLLPTALPREVVRRGNYEWAPMTIELVVPVRYVPATPPGPADVPPVA